MEEKRARILELVEQLNHAAAVYYQGRDEVMSNYEYDKQYDELQALEKETGIVLAGSPTQRVGYEVLSELPKEQHPSPMLSLDKTKDTEQLAAWLGEHPGLLSWKMDGLTIVLTYQEGTLQKAVTRGNGQVGEVITGNARMFDNVPLQIPFQGELVLRGEAVITYSRFREINESLPAEEQYKNPRNLCSGSVRQLDSRVTKSRHVNFFAFSLVTARLSNMFVLPGRHCLQQWQNLQKKSSPMIFRRMALYFLWMRSHTERVWEEPLNFREMRWLLSGKMK